MSFDCEETYRRFGDYLDRELSLDEMRLVREHLDGCGICAEEYLFEETVLRRVRYCLADSEVPQDLFARISARLDSAVGR